MKISIAGYMGILLIVGWFYINSSFTDISRMNYSIAEVDNALGCGCLGFGFRSCPSPNGLSYFI